MPVNVHFLKISNPTMKYLCILFMLFSFFVSTADNKIRIIPDSTNQFAMFEISRNHAAQYKITFANEKGTVLHKSVAYIHDKPTIISISWKDFNPGFYYLTGSNKRETFKLLFVKKK